MTAGKTPKSTSHSRVSKLILLILTLQILIKTDEKFDHGVINGDLEMRTSGSSSWKTLFLVFRVTDGPRIHQRWQPLDLTPGTRTKTLRLFHLSQSSGILLGLRVEWMNNHQKSSTVQKLHPPRSPCPRSYLDCFQAGARSWKSPLIVSLCEAVRHDLHPGLYFNGVRQVAGR